MARPHQQQAFSATKILCGVVVLAGFALIPIYFVENLYLPQRNQIDDQQSDLDALHKEMQALKIEQSDEHSGLFKRIAVLEATIEALKSTLPDANKAVATQAALEAEKREEAKAKARRETAEKAVKAQKEAAEKKAKKEKAPAPPAQKWLPSHKCGASAPLADGSPSECDPSGQYPCCGASGWCGNSAEHCTCSGCVDYRTKGAAPVSPPPAPESPAETYNIETPKRIALVVPFRDRGPHLEKFRERIQSHIQSWNAKGIHHFWKVFVVEQFDENLFNRGYLFNVGFHYATIDEAQTGKKFDCVVMHDIDILPTPVVDYGWCQWPNQLSGEIECWGWGVPYPDNVGGVVSLSPNHWRAINGFSNEYEGWGGEDDDLYLRLKIGQLLRGGCHTWCQDKKRPTMPMVRRPPIGQGKMTCLHDGDHTPRQRAPEDAIMWQRLNAMKGGSARWKTDGVNSLKIFTAGEALESKECEDDKGCKAAEDPVLKQRLFAEQWSRVSSKPIGKADRVEVVRLPGSHGCGNISRPLPVIPAGLESMRELLPTLFAGHCDDTDLKEWAHRANFLLVDLTLGTALLAGSGVELVTPDGSLPTLKAAGEQAAPPALAATEHLLQAQRFSRWMRKLPETHRGWIVVLDEALSVWQSRFVDSGRRVPLLTPACVSKASYSGGGTKYRVTPGTKWCGDGGWAHVLHFKVLRSHTNVKAENRVPICISYNKNGYAYRFENSPTGCIGKSNDISWVHAHTIYTSTDAQGDEYCVGKHEAGAGTRWALFKQGTCNTQGFTHSFRFRAMTEQKTAPLAPCCLLAEEGYRDLQLGAVQRFAMGVDCETGARGWKLVRKFVLLGERSSASDHHICMAKGRSEKVDNEKNSTQEDSTSETEVHRVFWDSACAKKSLVTYEGSHKFHWQLHPGPPVFLPREASGLHFCLCHIAPVEPPQDPGRRRKAKEPRSGKDPFYSWFESACPEGAKQELCFNSLGPADVLRYVHMIDEIV